MRSSRHILAICVLFALVSFVRASVWGQVGPMAQPGAFVKRQDSSSTESTEPTKTDKEQTADSTGTDTAQETETGTDSATGTDTNIAEETGTGTKTGTKTKGSKTTSIDPRLPPGGIQMITPAATAAATYIKIGDYATFKWNYTSLSVTPSAIDVVAYCSSNAHTYTIAANQSVEETGAVTWDTSKDATGTYRLLTATYTLFVYDSAKDPSAAASPGYLGSLNGYRFGMYTPQPYTPLGKFKCATCQSAAMSDIERQGLKFMFGMVVVTILSFTWFVTGLGLFG